ncbi:iron-containing redox enzyme family protein [Kitasatospora sp. RG8]|uniref:iron-containing redox enzyme family protein n=1 Tax=Kitasatospora sp. RG8 TaxID=2820815 RepID=UPI001ADF0931|nr:iron-containing redox enzyme family protein [Kitasatospora sp. RG8]MBP0450636.1 iron-containing redox enzyme family protein [Kitasatospora sp. RG8]
MITTPVAPRSPTPRGPLSDAVRAALTSSPGTTARRLEPVPIRQADPWGEDLQLALYVCYELHYRGFTGVDPGWEWNPELLRLRGEMEQHFLAAVREQAGEVPPLDELLARLLTEPRTGDGPSHFLLAGGERWQAREYLVHRSLYHLKEADPQLWAAPRLGGAAQTAFLSIEYDEYGAGHPERAHSRLFAEMMADFGLDSTYGRYVDAAAAPALEVVNLMSLFGLHRALRGALIGQFATVEITSSPGSARLVRAFERLGAGPAGLRFYREHVEADAVHEQLVRHGVIGPLLATEPALAGDVAFGIAASSLAEGRLSAHLTGEWAAGRSSLRGGPLAEPDLG